MKKYAKILALSAFAALALMAMGASTASANICSKAASTHTPVTLCSVAHGNVYNGAIVATSTNAQLTSGFVNVKCTHSVLEGTVTGTTTTGQITKLSFTGCSNNLGQACTASTTASSGAPWHAISKTGAAPNGTMEVSTVTGQFTCGSTTCYYKSAKVGGAGELQVIGGAPAHVTIGTGNPVKLEREEGSGGLCSSSATWHGTYTVTTPSSLYLT